MRRVILLIAGTTAFLPVVGHAFRIERDPVPVVVAAPKPTEEKVVVFNPNAEEFPVLKGLGRHLPLVQALEQVVPKSYLVVVDPAAQPLIVSWKGGADWVSVVREMFADEPVKITINAKQHKFTLQRVDKAEQSIAKSEPVPVKVWEIRLSDGTVKAALQRWSAEAGYTLFWELPRTFDVTPATFSGEFSDVLLEVAKGYFESDAPFKVVIQDDDPNNKSVRVVPYTGNRVTGRTVAGAGVKQ